MKNILIITFSLISINSFGQKISPYNYKNVDTLDKYKNAQIIKYRDKTGNRKSDTIYYKKQTANVNIESVEEMNIYENKKLKR